MWKRDYIIKFKKYVQQFVMVEGSRDYPEFLNIFITGLPARYLMEKRNFSSTDLDEAFDFFWRLAKREASLQAGPTTTNSNTRSNSHSWMTGKSKVVIRKITTQKGERVIRCFKCGGFGHSKEQCPTPLDVCHNCGDPSHKKRECSTKVFRLIGTDLKLDVDNDEWTEVKEQHHDSIGISGYSSPSNDEELLQSVSPTAEQLGQLTVLNDEK